MSYQIYLIFQLIFELVLEGVASFDNSFAFFLVSLFTNPVHNSPCSCDDWARSRARHSWSEIDSSLPVHRYVELKRSEILITVEENWQPLRPTSILMTVTANWRDSFISKVKLIGNRKREVLEKRKKIASHAGIYMAVESIFQSHFWDSFYIVDYSEWVIRSRHKKLSFIETYTDCVWVNKCFHFSQIHSKRCSIKRSQSQLNSKVLTSFLHSCMNTWRSNAKSHNKNYTLGEVIPL